MTSIEFEAWLAFVKDLYRGYACIDWGTYELQQTAQKMSNDPDYMNRFQG
jgi:hypothetical protein